MRALAERCEGEQSVSSGVQVRNLVKSYGDQLAVKGLSFDVAAGEFISLLGPSGCGKTTTLRCIGGYETPTSGDIMIDGQRVNETPVHRRNIGMVFQSYALFPHKKVRDNVAFALKMQGLSRADRLERAAEALSLVQMEEFAERYPAQLSGGQRQRVALARAIIHRPKVLLLDEPLANLDRKLREAMRIELKQLQEKVRICAILVTHDQEEAMAISDRIAVMNEGRIHQYAAPFDVYNAPTTRFVASFIGQTNLLVGTVMAVEGTVAQIKLSEATTIEAEVQAECRPGSEVTLSIRPERISMSRQATGRSNVIEGTVEFVTFLGSWVVYRLKTNCGLLLEATEPVIAERPHYAEGDKVYVTWPTDRSLILA